ncbi:antileukoproteinase-like [Liolophura sinensis]|uniref:antileukoproteinase-like n=1 Tax=Liolophura sinensis TaxID=3198878 RepID=UPI003158973D
MGMAYGTSVPILCEDMACEDGSTCVTVQSEPCTPRFCLPPHGECVAVSTKTGMCPNRLENPACLSLRGVPQCTVDNDCQDDKKCCDGCCKTPDVEPVANESPVLDGTPGSCPVEENISSLRIWTGLYCPDVEVVDQCLVDAECPAMQKCCTTLCGNRCKRALHILPPVAQ